MRRLLLILLLLLESAVATVYTVGSGKTYATPSACSAVAIAGDTCQIFAGTYAGWTQGTSGTVGNPIIFTANTGDTVNISSGVTISGRNYVTISYLNFTSSSGISGSSDFTHITIDHCTFVGNSFKNSSTTGNTDNVFSNNVITVPTGSKTITIFLYGDRNRFENNEYSGSGDDFMDLAGSNLIVRGNYAHDLDAQGSVTNNHIDFIQAQPGDPMNLRYSLIEHNREVGCLNDAGNCHFIIIRGDSTSLPEGNIIRFNYAQNLDGAGVVNGGGSTDQNQYLVFYNNTIALEKSYTEIGGLISCWQGVPTYTTIVNNIGYNDSSSGFSPSGCGASDTVVYQNGDISYTTGFSGAWTSPYSTEATYNTLKNLNPLFANYPTDGTLDSISPARNAGADLATVTSTVTSSTSLPVNRVHAFQPGWAGTSGDCIRVGASTVTCITAITYDMNSTDTGTLTVTPAVSATVGTAVNLYSDSSGTVVLSSAQPDIGAYPYSSGPPPISTGSSASGSTTIRGAVRVQ